MTRFVALAFVVVAVFGIAACDEPASSLRPSASLLDVEFTPHATATPQSTDEPTTEPTFISIPVGWDNSFCAVFANVADAHELIIDVERAIAEENVRDAKGLARDLRAAAADATTLIADVDDWEPGMAAKNEMAVLIRLYGRAGDEYGTAYTDESRAAMRRARGFRRDVANETPAANEALAGLTEIGITCDGLPLVLEEF